MGQRVRGTAKRKPPPARRTPKARRQAKGTAKLPTRRELAALLEKHPQTIVKWEQAGMPVAEPGRRGMPSRYREADVRAWLAAREAVAKDPATVDLTRDRSRRERAQAILAEQMFQTRARDLLPRVDVERIWSAEIAAVRTKLLAWSTALADKVHRVAVLEGLIGVERVLRVAVEDVLTELADPHRITEV